MGNPVQHECFLFKCSPEQVITRCFVRYGNMYLGNDSHICKVNYCGICGYEYTLREKILGNHDIFNACRLGKFYCHKSLLFGSLIFSNGGLHGSPVKRCPFCGMYSDDNTTTHY